MPRLLLKYPRKKRSQPFLPMSKSCCKVYTAVAPNHFLMLVSNPDFVAIVVFFVDEEVKPITIRGISGIDNLSRFVSRSTLRPSDVTNPKSPNALSVPCACLVVASSKRCRKKTNGVTWGMSRHAKRRRKPYVKGRPNYGTARTTMVPRINARLPKSQRRQQLMPRLLNRLRHLRPSKRIMPCFCRNIILFNNMVTM